jgi:DNA-binding transcriptional ArsR family regulator
MAALTDKTLAAATDVRSAETFPTLVVEADAAISLVVEPDPASGLVVEGHPAVGLVVEGDRAIGLVVEGEQWAAPAVDPLVPTSLSDLRLPAVLHALSDPVRLRIVLQLAEGGEQTCGALDVPVAKSTCSHHFRVLREAGVVAQRVDGKCRYNRLRTEELQQRFPGLLDAVLRAEGPTDPDRA